MITLYNINKKYNNKRIISNFSYQFDKGQIYSIIGKSGCGKSTLLSIISKNNSYQGEIYYNKINIKQLKNYTIDCVSYVYQSYQLFNNMTVYDNITIQLKLLNKNINNYQRKIEYLLKYFNVYSIKDNLVKDLSGGEKQRVAIIKALIKDSTILLLDEPTSALDKNNSDKLFEYLKSIKKDKIIIIVTHDLSLANKCDLIIDFNNYKKISIDKISYKKYSDKKHKLKSLSKLYKEVFSFNKFFKYICSSILSFSLISICLCEMMYSFINQVINKSFSTIKNDNQITLISNDNNENINFNNNIVKGINHVYYEGINSSLKDKLKKEIVFDNIKYNDKFLVLKSNYNFIFDNYLSTFKENIVLFIPKVADIVSLDNNFLTFSVYSKKYIVNVDKIYFSEDDYFYLYCNNVLYLNQLFKDLKVEISLDKYIYSPKINNIYERLINDKKYRNFLFYLDEVSNVILIKDSNIPRISYEMLIKIIYDNNITNYIYSDYINTFIDYDSGFIYIISNNEAIQVIIDESINYNYIDISNKYYLLTNNDKTIKVNNTYLIVNEIKEENVYPIIYMSSKTFNDLNDKNTIFSMIIFNKKNIVYDKNLISVNSDLFDILNYKVFDYITIFIVIFALIISILSIVTINVIFSINFINKKKDIKCLYYMGVYKNSITNLLLFDPIETIITSLFSSIISYIFIKIIISVFYYQISHVMLDINISYSFILLVILFSFLFILPPIFLKIRLFLNKI